jgi:hypothetical protein
MGSTKLTLEGGSDGAWLLAGLWFNNDVCVRWLLGDVCCDVTIGQALELHIEKCNGAIHFFFSSEFHSFVHSI